MSHPRQACLVCIYDTIITVAMLLHPSVMRKVQAELDSVVGKERLPGFQDRDSLPYMQAVIKEILRLSVSRAGQFFR